MEGIALIIGSGGIGKELGKYLFEKFNTLDVILCGRSSESDLYVDVEDYNTLQIMNDEICARKKPLRIVINATGRLHNNYYSPEKRLQHINDNQMIDSFKINAMAPILIAKSIENLIPKDKDFNFASLSARVGSISDNRLGGWYSYRASKAAQNQFLKTLSIEWSRKFPKAIVSVLHPGTVDTNLSRPFQSAVPENKLFSTKEAAKYLVENILNEKITGRFIAWDGKVIEW